MINRHAQAGSIAAILMHHDSTCELLPLPACVKLSKEDAEAIEKHLFIRENPSNRLKPDNDFRVFQNQIKNHGQATFRRHRLQSNDLVCCRKGSPEVIYLKVLFDDYQQKKNYRPNQRRRQVREFLRTYAGLAEYYKRTEGKTLRPLLGVLSNVCHETSTYLPQDNVLYGEQLFKEIFPALDFDLTSDVIRGIGEEPETIQIFDALYRTVLSGGLGKQLPETNPVTSDEA